MNEKGWEDTILWNPYGSEAMGYNNFVCVESAKVRVARGKAFYQAIVYSLFQFCLLLVSLIPLHWRPEQSGREFLC